MKEAISVEMASFPRRVSASGLCASIVLYFFPPSVHAFVTVLLTCSVLMQSPETETL